MIPKEGDEQKNQVGRDMGLDGGVSTSPYGDLARPPLSEKALRRLLVRPGSLWQDVTVVPETGSTNADLATAAKAGAPEGTVLIAEAQLSGRGRLGRDWSAPPRSGLLFSVLLRPPVEPQRLGWLPLLTGVAVVAAVRRMTARARAGDFGEPTGDVAVDARLKWPNDVLVDERKLAGILAERVGTPSGDAVVMGVGLNVSLRAEELPVPAATSLVLEDAAFTDREPLLRAILRELDGRYAAWCAVGGDPEGGLRADYEDLCDTLGRPVRVQLPGSEAIDGTADGIDSTGCLVVRTSEGDRAISAGDVVHVRPRTP
jgi:BirA family transcriptional regulator, biotin operon repressor / biotin---[acetyl-CoA-carboxylase] ligase